MRALVLTVPSPVETAPLRLEERPTSSPGAGEVLVRVSACGVCRTDLHIVEGELSPMRPSIVPGHQVVGRVERAGPNAHRFRPGDRVGIAWLRATCGACESCRAGRENLCERAEFTGYHADGGFADYAIVDERFAYAIPPVFGDAEAAPLLCAGIIGYRALKLAEVRPGGRLGVYGFGASAHVTVQVARARGIEVFVCTREESHRELARRGVGRRHRRRDARQDERRNPVRAGRRAGAGRAPKPRAGRHPGAGRHLHVAGEELLTEAARIPIRTATTTFPLEDANRALSLLKRGKFAGAGVLLTGEGSRV
jgi:alcohol dehydrogenase, propanol-preferring